MMKRWQAATALILGAILLGVLIWVVGPLSWMRAPTPTPSPTPTSWPRERMDSPEYGMQAFMWWKPEVAARDLGLIRDAGFTWVKQNVGWRDVEGAGKGTYEWARVDRIVDQVEDAELNLLFRIDSEPAWAVPERGIRHDADNGPPGDPQDLGDFCYALAERYKGRVDAYQVWNEPNLASEWGGWAPDPAGYVELLRACYIGVKMADPEALVISAGLAPTGTPLPDAMSDTDYLIGMYEAGAARYFDLLGAHASGFAYPPETAPETVAEKHGGHRFFCFRRVEDLREIMVEAGDGDKQVAVLEMGWTLDPRPDSPYHWHAVTQEQQADYLVRAFQYAEENWSPWIGLMTVSYIADPFWTEADEQYWWAITEPGWPESNLRPAYEALKEMEK